MSKFWIRNVALCQKKIHIKMEHVYALRTPEERLLSGAPKEEFGRTIFASEKKSFVGDCMMMIALISFKSSLVPLFEGL